MGLKRMAIQARGQHCEKAVNPQFENAFSRGIQLAGKGGLK